MLSTSAVVSADRSPGFRVQVELDLGDLLPPARGLMPVSFTGRLLNLDDRDREAIGAAKSIEMLFAGTDMRYEAIVDRKTLEFRAIDTSERGL